MYYDLKKYDEALKAYQNVLQYKKNDFYSLGVIGEIYNIKQNYQEALKYLLQCYDMHYNQKEKEINCQIGISYNGLKQYDKAEEHFKKSLSLDPNFKYVLAELGEIYYNQNRNEEAIKTLLVYYELDPNYERVNSMLGNCYNRLNQWDKAEPYFKKLLALNPKDETILILAQISYNLGKWNEVITYYEKIIHNITEDINVAYFNFGFAYYQVKQFEKARDNWKKCIENDKSNPPEPYVLLAICEMRLNNPNDAEKDCEKSLEFIKNENPFVYYNSACVYSLLNKVDKSLELMEKALKTGKVDIPHMESDDDLINIRQTEGYKKLISKYK